LRIKNKGLKVPKHFILYSLFFILGSGAESA